MDEDGTDKLAAQEHAGQDLNSDALDPRKKRGKQGEAIIRNREVFYKDDVIIKQGEEAHRAFYIESGSVKVTVKKDGTEIKVTELEAGDIIGEMALIERTNRTATVTALETTTVVTISEDEMHKRIDNIGDEAVQALLKIMIARLRETTEGQVLQYKSLSDFHEKVVDLVERVEETVDTKQRENFRKEIDPILEQLQAVLDKYKK